MTGFRARLGALTGAALAATLLATAPPAAAAPPTPGGSTLIGRAVLPVATFAGGPVSGQYIGASPINGQQVPFRHQPVQGFSALVPVRGAAGDYWALADNGYGSEENSADFQLP
jgi:glycerophosphoryl diester phosphodiesterase